MDEAQFQLMGGCAVSAMLRAPTDFGNAQRPACHPMAPLSSNHSLSHLYQASAPTCHFPASEFSSPHWVTVHIILTTSHTKELALKSEFTLSAMSTQSTMTNLDTDHSGLVMAVAAMNVTNSSTTALPSSCTEQMVMGSGGLDSGYASQSSTPDTSKVTFVDRGVVSGRNIWAHAFRKTKELRPYNKPIPQLTHERFSDLRELYADSLNEFTRNLPNCRGVLMSLQVLGENEATAEPWVFVQCDKAIFKRVSNFFKQPFVKIEFEPPKPTDLSPRLRVIVCPLKLRQLAKYTALSSQHNPLALSDIIQIFGDQDGISSGTLCGTQVMNGISHGLRKATMGGVIVVADKKGEVKLFGMTAGHFLLQESYEESQDEVSDDLEDDFYIEEEAFELDLSSFDANIEEEEILPHEGAEDKCDDKAALLGWSKIGELSVASHTYLEDERNLDWALTTIDEQSVSLPNIIMSYYELKQCKFNGLEKGVIMVSARGPVWGTLSKSWSYMMLSPGKILVRTYLLTLSNNACK
jgi:hypothetical protein